MFEALKSNMKESFERDMCHQSGRPLRQTQTPGVINTPCKGWEEKGKNKERGDQRKRRNGKWRRKPKRRIKNV